MTSMPSFPFSEARPLELDPQLARLRAEDPVRRVLVDGKPAWLVTRHGDVRTVLTDRRFSLARAWEQGVPRLGTLNVPPGALLAMDPPEHTRLRKLVSKAFGARRIERMRPRVEELVNTLLDRMAALEPPVDLVENFAAALPIEIVCELLGVPAADRDLFQRWTDRLFSVSGTTREEKQLAFERITDYIGGLVADRRRAPTDDLFSTLVAVRDEQGRLSEQELVIFGATLLSAGHDTTKSELAHSVLLLLSRRPDLWRRLMSDPARIPDAVEELLRRVPLMNLDVTFPRVATQPVQLGQVTIDEGELVLASITSANFDETVFDDPTELHLDRGDIQHLAFGVGVHHCLGAQLARLELELGLRGLLTRFPDLELAVPESELRTRQGGFVRGLRSLPVRWSPEP